MLRTNEDGEWMMPRGISAHDMAHEILDAVENEDFRLPPERLPKDLSIAREYVKVTVHGNSRPTKLHDVRRTLHGF